MGTNAFKQIVRTIQNKIPVSKGLIRRSRETEQGYLADIHNFELEDGTLKFRQGTRLMANMEDELWYDIQSFKFGNTELVMGINYKRELWGWLAKWPETSFKIWNTSPFRRTYPHVINGNAKTNGHFSFERGNKFYMLEDNFSVILVNDYAEIFRIMKNGCFRITADEDYPDQREAIQDARDDDSLREGRIYLDIKEATNKVFNKRMYIGDEYIRRSHRITGETRFAWVNELGVVSELSDPIDIEGYRHVVVSTNKILDYDKSTKSIPIKRIVSSGSVVSDNCNFYGITENSIEILATEGQTWTPANPFTDDSIAVLGIVLEIKESGYWYESDGTEHKIDSGIYVCFSDKATGNPIEISNNDWNYSAIKLFLKSPDFYVSYNDGTSQVEKLVGSPWKNQEKFFKVSGGVSMPLIKKVDYDNPIEFVSFSGEYWEILRPFNFANIKTLFPVIDWQGNLELNDVCAWVKLSEISGTNFAFNTDSAPFLIMQPDTSVALTNYDNPKFVGNGRVYFVDLTLKMDTTGTTKYGWSEYDVVALEIDFDGFKSYSQVSSKGYDCWVLESMASSLSISAVDLYNKRAMLSGVGNDTDLIVFDEVSFLNDNPSRFALWNNSYIQGISQRFFHNDTDIIYEGLIQEDPYNMNYQTVPETTKIGYAPLMTLDYTGLRRIPMPLPMIRRAMRNPQHLTTAGGKVYSVEDNKIWVGSVDDFMMTDFIEIHSAVDHIASMDTGIVVSTRQGLFYVASGEGIKRVIGGEMVMSKFLAPCSGGVLSVDGRDIHIVYKQVTDSGAWYPTVAKINNALTEINLEGEIKSVSIGDMIYIADDWNVWIYDMANKVWAGKRHYKNRIHRLFAYKNKLGVAFETGVDRRNSFNNESEMDN